MPQDTIDYQDALAKLPDDFITKSQEFVASVFRVLTEQPQQLGDDLAEFAQERSETKERIRRGARRTTGRIV